MSTVLVGEGKVKQLCPKYGKVGRYTYVTMGLEIVRCPYMMQSISTVYALLIGRQLAAMPGVRRSIRERQI